MNSWLEPLIKNTPLAVFVVGVFLFIMGAAGGFATLKLEVKELGWRIALAAMGAVVAASGGLFFWLTNRSHLAIKEPKPISDLPEGDPRRKIEGIYYAEGDPNYKNLISHISDSIFKITNPVWDGVGIFDGETYFGVFKYNSKALPKDRDMWGTHKADLRFGVLEISGIDMNPAANAHHWQGKWFKADD